MRTLLLAAVVIALAFVNLTAIYDILAGESDVRAEWATIGISGLLVAWLLARTLHRRAESE